MKRFSPAILSVLLVGMLAVPCWSQEESRTLRSPRVPHGEFDFDTFKVFRPASSEECSPLQHLSSFGEPFQFWKEDVDLSAQVRELSVEATDAAFESLRPRADRVMGVGTEYDLLVLPSLHRALLVPTAGPRGQTVEEVSEEFFPCRYLVIAGNGMERGIYSHLDGNLEIDRDLRYLPAAKGSILEVDLEDPEVKTHEVNGVERQYIKVDVKDGGEGRFRCYSINSREGSNSPSKVSPAIFYLTDVQGKDVAIPIEWCRRSDLDLAIPGGAEPGASIGMQKSIKFYNFFAEQNNLPSITSLEVDCDRETSTLEFQIELSHVPQALPLPLAVVAAYSYFTAHRCNAADHLRWTFLSVGQNLPAAAPPGEDGEPPASNGDSPPKDGGALLPQVNLARENFQNPGALLEKLTTTHSWGRVTDSVQGSGSEGSERLRVHFNQMMGGKYPEVKNISGVKDGQRLIFSLDLAKAPTEMPPAPSTILCAHLYASRDDCKEIRAISCQVPSQGWEFEVEVPSDQSCDASKLRNLWR